MLEIDTENRTNKGSFHLAGIVPVSGEALDFKMPWHDSMMPIGPDYTMVERAILECAWAGCETIWVVCYPDIMPLLKHKIGNFVYEPVNSFYTGYNPAIGVVRSNERVPIFYVSVMSRHIGKRDSLGFSALQGAYHAFYIGWVMSRWYIPNMYYVAFPYGVYHPKQLKNHRTQLSVVDKNYLVTSPEGKTIMDGEYLGFTFSRSQFKLFRDRIKRKIPGPDPRTYTLDDIFVSDIITEHEAIPIKSYHNVGSWNGYRDYMGSDQSKFYTADVIKKYFKDFKHTLIGETDDGNV